MRRSAFLVTAFASFGALAFACLPGSGPSLVDGIDGSPPPLTSLDDGGAARSDVDLGDPFAIVGLTPSHGPFTGGTRTVIAGRGFSTQISVYFAGTKIDPSEVLASDPMHAAVVTPPGTPGPVSVRIVDDVTKAERTLDAAFTYDALTVTPSSGATSGGTRISITGSGTTFVAGATVSIGGGTCTQPNVKDATHIDCVTPAAAGPGSQDVTVTLPGGSTIQARDAFTYSDAPDSNRGGLSGGALAGRITVLALDSFTAQPIPNAKVILNTDSGGAKSTSASGVIEIDDPSLNSPVTVTVAAKCHQPTTFVNVPVDHVTVYLDPTLDISCASGDPPSTGGGGGHYGGAISGELVFPGGVEFRRGNWQNVPPPSSPTERNAAYVIQASDSPDPAFTLPAVDLAITTDAPGTQGYAYDAIVYPGNVTLYALAGIEDRSFDPPRFTAYVMGVARGIAAQDNTEVTGVNIAMTTLLDHELVLSATAPTPGPKGPDRFRTNIAVTLGASGFAILPNAQKTTQLPLGNGAVTTIGLPSLDNGLAGESYVAGAVAATGPNLQLPASVVSRIKTTNANTPVSLGGFLNVPVITEPAAAPWSGTHVAFTASGTYDVSVTTIAGSLVSWTIFAPGGVSAFDLPDLGKVVSPDPLGVRRGTIDTTIYTARLDGFSYATVRYGQLSTGGWNAYAVDEQPGVY